MASRPWRLYGRFRHSPLWEPIASALSSEDAARERLKRLFHITEDSEVPMVEARITGPGVSLLVQPKWPGPGQDFEMIEHDELART